MLSNALQQQLDEHANKGKWRNRQVRHAPTTSMRKQAEGNPVIAFNSNDYLGFANHPSLKNTAQHALDQYGFGSGSAQLIDGYTKVHAQLEQALVDWSGYEAALVLSTGYMANLSVLTALCQAGDIILQDQLNHASLLDGGQLAKARSYRFKHKNNANLSAHLNKQQKAKQRFIVTDSLFSMRGDVANLPELVKLAEAHQATLIVDEAHAFGTLGLTGKGAREHFSLTVQQVPIVTGTFGKAFGGFGAFILGSKTVIEACIQFARPYIFTTALPPAVIAANLAGLNLLQSNPSHLKQLKTNISLFKQLLLQHLDRETQALGAVQPILTYTESATLAASEKLKTLGFLVGAIRPPTVPKEECCLRITLSATHTGEQIEQLILALKKVLQ